MKFLNNFIYKRYGYISRVELILAVSLLLSQVVLAVVATIAIFYKK